MMGAAAARRARRRSTRRYLESIGHPVDRKTLKKISRAADKRVPWYLRLQGDRVFPRNLSREARRRPRRKRTRRKDPVDGRWHGFVLAGASGWLRGWQAEAQAKTKRVGALRWPNPFGLAGALGWLRGWHGLVLAAARGRP